MHQIDQQIFQFPRYSNFLILPNEKSTFAWEDDSVVLPSNSKGIANKNFFSCFGCSSRSIESEILPNFQDPMGTIKFIFEMLPTDDSPIFWGAALLSGERCIDIFTGKIFDQVFSNVVPNLPLLDLSLLPWNKSSNEAVVLIKCNLTASLYFGTNRKRNEKNISVGGIFQNYRGLVFQFHRFDRTKSTHMSSLTILFLDNPCSSVLSDMIFNLSPIPKSKNIYNQTNARGGGQLDINGRERSPVQLGKGSEVIMEILKCALDLESHVAIHPPHPSLSAAQENMRAMERNRFSAPSPHRHEHGISTIELLRHKDNLPASFISILKDKLTLPSPASPPGWSFHETHSVDTNHTLSLMPDWSMQNNLAAIAYNSRFVLEPLTLGFPHGTNVDGMHFRAKAGDNIVVNQGWDRANPAAITLILPGEKWCR